MNGIYKIARKKRSPIINMAPLIDMVFLLLIFFMLTTTLGQHAGIDVRKPKAISSQLLPRRNIIITVSREGEVYLEGEKLSWEEFKRKLKTKIETSSPDSMVIVVCDVETEVSPVVDVMDEAVKFGAQRLSIATEYEKWKE